MAKEIETQEARSARRRPLTSRVIETSVFISMILLTSLAVMTVAVAAPLVLGVTAFAGFFSRKRAARRWRPVGA